MSAIFGILRLDGAPVDPGDLERMGRCMAHCGPDGRDSMVFGHVGLGACLMQVTVEDQWEVQPLHDGGLGVTLVADLRLDNRDSLAGDLGVELEGLSDSGLLLEAWRQWGEACVDRLIGDFAFALWDHRQRRLYVARDPMGQRGVFIHEAPGMVVFATEIKALWGVTGLVRRLDDVGLARRLLGTLDPDPGRTLYAQVSVLPGGCIRWFDDRGHGGQRRYWEPRAGAQHLGHDEAYYIDAYRRVVEEAIACRVRRLRGGAGLLMSGGFDSGTIAAIAAPVLHARAARLVGIASVLPEGERRALPGEMRALPDARRAVEAFAGMAGLDLHYQCERPASFYENAESHFLREDGPLAVGPMRRMAYGKLGEQRIRQVMDGHGGDYTVNGLAAGMLGRMLLAGRVGAFWREFRARRAFTRWPVLRILRNDVLRPLVPTGLLRRCSWVLRGGRPLWRDAMTRDDFALAQMKEGGIQPERLRDMRVATGKWEQGWQHMLWRVVNTAPPQAPAAVHGLVLTRPFHDPRVVELGLALPASLHFREGRERWLARNVFADCLPPELVARPPGNDQEEPDLYAMVMAGAWDEVSRLEAHRGKGLHCVDPAKIAAVLKGAQGKGTLGHHRAFRAACALMLARFADWVEPDNRAGQDPYGP